MKSNARDAMEQMNKETGNHLLKEVKETLATSTSDHTPGKKNFTAVEMWHRQRKVRSASAMIRRWNLN